MKRLMLAALMLVALPGLGQKKISELPNFVPTLADYVVAVDTSGGITGRLYFSQIKTLVAPASSDLANIISGGGAVSYQFPGIVDFSNLIRVPAGLFSVGDMGGTEGQIRWYTSDNNYYAQVVSSIQPFNRILWLPNGSRFYDTLATMYDIRASTGGGTHNHTYSQITNFANGVSANLIAGSGIGLSQNQSGQTMISASGGQFYQTVVNGVISYPQREKLRFVSGTNVTIAASDDEGGDQTVITISSTASGSGGMSGQEIVDAVNGIVPNWQSAHQFSSTVLFDDIVSIRNNNGFGAVLDANLLTASKTFRFPANAGGTDTMVTTNTLRSLATRTNLASAGGLRVRPGTTDSLELDPVYVAINSTSNSYYGKQQGDSSVVNGQLHDSTTYNGKTTTFAEGNINVKGWDLNEQVLAHVFIDDSLVIKRFVTNGDYYVVAYLPDSVYATKVVFTQLSTSYDLEVDVGYNTTLTDANDWVSLITPAPVMNTDQTADVQNAGVFSYSPAYILVNFSDANVGDMAYPRGIDITVLGYRK